MINWAPRMNSKKSLATSRKRGLSFRYSLVMPWTAILLVELSRSGWVDVEVATGQAAPLQLDTADLDDPVTIGHRHAGGFGIQYDATHL